MPAILKPFRDISSGLLEDGFQKTDLVSDPNAPAKVYFVTAVVLSLTKLIDLDPAASPHDVVRATARASLSGPDACGPCTFRFEPTLSLRGFEEPFNSVITWDRQTVSPATFGEKATELCPRFLRGDTSSDGRVDISDAVRTFMYLFLGASEPRCLDAADSTDDGKVDISDGIAILDDFFRPGTGIPDPGPFYCGSDPTPDGLSCARYDACLER